MLTYSGKRLLSSYKRAKKLSIEEWCEKNVIFNNLEVSPILGNFKVKYSPHYKKLFQLVERKLTRELFAEWGSQSGKSLFGVLISAYKLDTMPSTVIYAQPLKDDISVILQTKINPVLKSIPSLWHKFEDYKDAEKIRTKDAAKKILGGNFLVKGSGVKDRKSQTSDFIVMDEVGEFENGAVFEYKERTKSFTKFHPKVIGLSTIVHPKDEICTNHDACSVKTEWHFVCMQCNHNFNPDPIHFKYTSKKEYMKNNNISEDELTLNLYIDEAKRTAHIECPNCEHKINTVEKDKMVLNDNMDWFIINSDKTSTRLNIDNLTTETSFGARMNSFGSFFITFEDIVENLIKAGDDETKLDKLYRGWFNKFYEKEVIVKEQSDMLLLGNNVDEFIVPKDTIKVYMTVDNQKDYLFVQITAYSYSLVRNIVYFGRVESWNDLEELWNICQYLDGEDGDTYMCSTMAIDRRGYNEGEVSRTNEADLFILYMAEIWGNDRIYAMEGHPYISGGKILSVTNMKDQSDNRVKLDTKVIKFSNLLVKNQLFNDLDRAIAYKRGDTGTEKYSSKMVFINQTNIDIDKIKVTDLSLTRMLTAEVFDFAKSDKTGKIALQKSWIQIRKRNDPIDTLAMADVLANKDKLFLVKKHSDENIDNVFKELAKLDFSN